MCVIARSLPVILTYPITIHIICVFCIIESQFQFNIYVFLHRKLWTNKEKNNKRNASETHVSAIKISLQLISKMARVILHGCTEGSGNVYGKSAVPSQVIWPSCSFRLQLFYVVVCRLFESPKTMLQIFDHSWWKSSYILWWIIPLSSIFYWVDPFMEYRPSV